MAYVHLVIVLALLEFLLFGYAVGRARTRYKVPAPAMSGHEVFDRYFRAQMNTLERLVVFLPSLWLFAHYINTWAAVALGASKVRLLTPAPVLARVTLLPTTNVPVLRRVLPPPSASGPVPSGPLSG